MQPYPVGTEHCAANDPAVGPLLVAVLGNGGTEVPKVRLTDRFAKNAKPTNGEARTDYFDDTKASRGLALRVSEGGHKSWSLHFTAPDGRRARVALGTYPATSLADARTKASEARGYLEESPPRDPRQVLADRSAGAMRVRKLVATYLGQKVRAPAQGKPDGLRSGDAIERRLNRNVVPIIGDMPVADLHRTDVVRVVRTVLGRGAPTEAIRVFEDVRTMLRWARGQGYVDTNVAADLQPPGKVTARERVLSADEIAMLWNGLPTALPRSKACQRIIKLCLVTMQRVGEVAGMRLDELDLGKARTWTLPESRTKNGTEQVVPLSDLAIEIIREAIAEAGRRPTYVFPSGKASLSPHAVARTIARARQATDEHPLGRFGIDHFTAHDLRRTGITNLARLGVAPIVAGAVANHVSVTKATVTLRHYSHYDYLREKREALNMWSDQLVGLISGDGANVVALSERMRRA